MGGPETDSYLGRIPERNYNPRSDSRRSRGVGGDRVGECLEERNGERDLNQPLCFLGHEATCCRRSLTGARPGRFV
jgi:hypothetical protein